jgi:hypothetical protein
MNDERAYSIIEINTVGCDWMLYEEGWEAEVL